MSISNYYFIICVSNSIQIISTKERLYQGHNFIHYFSLIENINKNFIIIIKRIQNSARLIIFSIEIESNVTFHKRSDIVS